MLVLLAEMHAEWLRNVHLFSDIKAKCRENALLKQKRPKGAGVQF